MTNSTKCYTRKQFQFHLNILCLSQVWPGRYTMFSRYLRVVTSTTMSWTAASAAVLTLLSVTSINRFTLSAAAPSSVVLWIYRAAEPPTLQYSILSTTQTSNPVMLGWPGVAWTLRVVKLLLSYSRSCEIPISILLSLIIYLVAYRFWDNDRRMIACPSILWVRHYWRSLKMVLVDISYPTSCQLFLYSSLSCSIFELFHI